MIRILVEGPYEETLNTVMGIVGDALLVSGISSKVTFGTVAINGRRSTDSSHTRRVMMVEPIEINVRKVEENG